MLLALLLALPTAILVDAQENFTVDVEASRIDVAFDGQLSNISHAQLVQWIQNAANAVIAYYGRFPVPHLTLQLRTSSGSGVHGGQTFSMRGGFTRIAIGRDSTPDDLKMDWMLTHEMVHLTFPSVADEHHWIEEGIATWVEPVARVQAGEFDEHRMWFEVVRDMPKGLPQSGDQGLDHTHTWGRTYWGGALFCFLADLEIRRRTDNRKGLQDALGAVLRAGGDMREEWEITKAFTIADRAVGVDVLMPMYQRMKDQSSEIDLDAIWKQLGVRMENGTVQFEDSAPLAAVRKSITATRSAAN